MIRPASSPQHPIYTFGYTGSTPGHLAHLVGALGAIVIDVRLVPRSRVPHWCQDPLRELLGITRYAWVPDLGNLHYRMPGAGVRLRNPAAGLSQVVPLLTERPVILLCACAYKDRATCHRSTVADLLHQETGAPVVHLPIDGVVPDSGAVDRAAAALATGQAWDGAPAVQGRLL